MPDDAFTVPGVPELDGVPGDRGEVAPPTAAVLVEVDVTGSVRVNAAGTDAAMEWRAKEIAAQMRLAFDCNLIVVPVSGRPPHQKATKGRWKSKLTPEQEHEIRTRYATGGVSHAKLAADYDCSSSTIRSVVNGEKTVDG